MCLTSNPDHGSPTVGRIAVGLDVRLIRRSTGIHVRYILFFDLMRCVMRTVEHILGIVENRQCQRSAVLFFGFLWKEQSWIEIKPENRKVRVLLRPVEYLERAG